MISFTAFQLLVWVALLLALAAPLVLIGCFIKDFISQQLW